MEQTLVKEVETKEVEAVNVDTTQPNHLPSVHEENPIYVENKVDVPEQVDEYIDIAEFLVNADSNVRQYLSSLERYKEAPIPLPLPTVQEHSEVGDYGQIIKLDNKCKFAVLTSPDNGDLFRVISLIHTTTYGPQRDGIKKIPLEEPETKTTDIETSGSKKIKDGKLVYTQSNHYFYDAKKVTNEEIQVMKITIHNSHVFMDIDTFNILQGVHWKPIFVDNMIHSIELRFEDCRKSVPEVVDWKIRMNLYTMNVAKILAEIYSEDSVKNIQDKVEEMKSERVEVPPMVSEPENHVINTSKIEEDLAKLRFSNFEEVETDEVDDFGRKCRVWKKTKDIAMENATDSTFPSSQEIGDTPIVTIQSDMENDTGSIYPLLATSPKEEIPSQEPSKEEREEWEKLLRRYSATIESTSGCGSRGQSYIDTAYKKMETFVRGKTGYRLPQKYICQDDGTGGFASGLSAMARRF
jgi:hypothetical protein